jgi:hypothetical protein
MKLSHRLLLATLAAASFAHAAPTERAADYETALARAKATGNDIAVFQYGSDWNPCSMAILEKVWSKPAFVSALGEGFILVGIDKPEVVGGRAVYGRCTEVNCGVSGFSDTAIGSAPPMNLEKLAKAEPPASELTVVTSEAGVPFARRADGAWSVSGVSVVPERDTLMLTVEPNVSGKYLRIDFPVGTPFFHGRPGLYEGNGNFALSGVSVVIGGLTTPMSEIWADGAEAPFVAENLIRPEGQPGERVWNAAAHLDKPRTLVLTLPREVRPGTRVTVKLVAASNWARHIPGALRAAVVADKAKAVDVVAVPPSQLTGVTSDAGTPYEKRAADGVFLAKIATNPDSDTLVLRMKTGRAGKLLRLDFPPDAALPAGGPGRASNGNAAISEVEILRDGVRIRPEFAWGSVNLGGTNGPWNTVDGVTDKPVECWNIGTHERHERRTLLVALKDSVPADTSLSVRIVCKSPWSQHTPGCVRAAMLADVAALADVTAVAKAQATQYRNGGFTWAGWGKMPRVSLLDKEGRPVAADPAPRATLTSEKLAVELKSFRAKREKRDALQTKANTATGPARAELLRQSLDALDIGRDPEFGRANGWGGGANGPYEPIHKAIREADPKDESGAVRWLGFSQGCWGAIPWAKGNEWWKPLEGKPEPTEADYAAAEACIDRELADPRNRMLDTDHIQHIMKARYDLYIRKLKGDRTNAKILDIQRAIAKVDPDTFWGVGATGYVGMFKRSDNPFMMYGFDGNAQLKPGTNAWTLSDGWMHADHAGPFKFSINYGGGKDALRVSRVAVLDGTKEIASGSPAPGEDTLDAAHRSVVVPFEIKTFRAGSKPVIRIEYEAQSGKFDVAGAFGMEPLLIEE